MTHSVLSLTLLQFWNVLCGRGHVLPLWQLCDRLCSYFIEILEYRILKGARRFTGNYMINSVLSLTLLRFWNVLCRRGHVVSLATI